MIPVAAMTIKNETGTRIMVYKKHREIFHMLVSNFSKNSTYDCCLFVA